MFHLFQKQQYLINKHNLGVKVLHLFDLEFQFQLKRRKWVGDEQQCQEATQVPQGTMNNETLFKHCTINNVSICSRSSLITSFTLTEASCCFYYCEEEDVKIICDFQMPAVTVASYVDLRNLESR